MRAVSVMLVSHTNAPRPAYSINSQVHLPSSLPATGPRASAPSLGRVDRSVIEWPFPFVGDGRGLAAVAFAGKRPSRPQRLPFAPGPRPHSLWLSFPGSGCVASSAGPLRQAGGGRPVSPAQCCSEIISLGCAQTPSPSSTSESRPAASAPAFLHICSTESLPFRIGDTSNRLCFLVNTSTGCCEHAVPAPCLRLLLLGDR